jgi:hypothetical protein
VTEVVGRKERDARRLAGLRDRCTEGVGPAIPKEPRREVATIAGSEEGFDRLGELRVQLDPGARRVFVVAAPQAEAAATHSSPTATDVFVGAPCGTIRANPAPMRRMPPSAGEPAISVQMRDLASRAAFGPPAD